LRSAFRKISRVGTLTGATKWYLSDDCLLAAKRVMYAVEYRRFYFRDLESIVVWPNRVWLLRAIIPLVLLAGLGALLWNTVNSTLGMIVCGTGVAWAALEVGLGPTAESRLRTTGATVNLPLVKRTRRAHRVLEKIETAVRAARGGVIEQAIGREDEPAQQPIVQSGYETASTTTPAAAPAGDQT
jgi:hypothetical protein